jgi:hypothetical protein
VTAAVKTRPNVSALGKAAEFIGYASAILLLGSTGPALTQPDYSIENRLECRATIQFKSCSRPIDKAPADALGIAGKVIASKSLSRWRARLTVEVTRATTPVQKSVEIDVFACYAWTGKIGDQITAIVYPQVDPRHGAHQLHPSCNR